MLSGTSANILRMGEDWESCICHLMSHWINICYLLDGLSKLMRIITYFQTREHEKLITTFFIGYFPSPFVCHKNLRFYWKLLWTIIYSLKLEKLKITFFSRKKKEKMWICYMDTYWNIYQYISIYRTPIHPYIVHLYIDILYTYTSIYRTPIHRYIKRNISIFVIHRYIIAFPNYWNTTDSG